MKTFLFLNYAEIKGYTFNVFTNDKPVNLKTFVNTTQDKEENIIFANCKGRVLGALRFKTAILPSNIFNQPEGGLSGTEKKCIVIDLFFLNDNPLRKDIIITGLLLTLRKYARKNRFDYCLGCSHKDLFEMVRANKLIRQEQFVECDNSPAYVLANIEKPFFFDFQKPLINIGFAASGRSRTSRMDLESGLLSKAA